MPSAPPDDNGDRTTVSASHIRERWWFDSIDWHSIRSDIAAEPDVLFYLVGASAFIESASDRYTDNLIEQFAGDDEIISWLKSDWLPEEMQHGRALLRYAQIVWPNFPWDDTYKSFLAEFSTHCCSDELEPTQTREMASRCVVEMGTAVYYTTLSRITQDPVLATIAYRIAVDEIRHYKHFYRFFSRYQKTKPERFRDRFAALLNRLRMIDGQDSVIAVKHLYRARNPDREFNDRIYRDLRRRSRRLIRPHFPYRMCVKMLLKPLDLGPGVRRVVLPLAAAVARRVV